MTTNKNLERIAGAPALALIGALSAGAADASPIDYLSAVYDEDTGNAVIAEKDMPHDPTYRLGIVPREDAASYILGLNPDEFPGATVYNNTGKTSQVLKFDYDLGQYLPVDIPATGLTIDLEDNFPSDLIDNNVAILDLISYGPDANQSNREPAILPVYLSYSDNDGRNTQVPLPGTALLFGIGLGTLGYVSRRRKTFLLMPPGTREGVEGGSPFS